jgi:hypothetical protein
MGTKQVLRQPTWPFPDSLVQLGEEVFPRELLVPAASMPSMATGVLRLTFFTSRKSFLSSTVHMSTGSTAAGATPTLVRWGLYAVDASGNGTLVASLANDTTIFATANAGYDRSWSVPIQMAQGKFYAFAALVVTAAAAPTVQGAMIGNGTEALQPPIMSASISALSDLPGTFAFGSLVGSQNRIYANIRP